MELTDLDERAKPLGLLEEHRQKNLRDFGVGKYLRYKVIHMKEKNG